MRRGVRSDAENSLTWNPDTVPQQKQAYSDIQPIYLAVPLDRAWGVVEETIMRLPWEVTYHNREQGIFEATSTSFWFGFVDDIVIRLTAERDKTRVDVRSVSRVGKSDLGKNAQRIRFFRQTLIVVAGR